ncbi:UvrD-helicase domain-containing protein [Chryseobacterium sp. YIM B08800]|uniref:UvrD-helicase domain-containing protein n=1 Tax=Chryseobacterium sp. YIM B08800 TaxID=2984136 RepID=UPI002240A45F|nr:ATP-dependent helicase [Chryseobacterium sp. YIM B08800]
MNNSIIEEKLRESHFGDEKQLEIIFSQESRLIIEAPAGYGKTKTMVSKIAYMLASNQIPYPKRLLALTFSVNAAYKIKKDVTQNIPIILEGTKSDFSISDKMLVTNYHGFARRILKRYGYKIHTSLIEIEKLQSVDDSDTKKLMQSISGLSYANAEILSNFNTAVKNVSGKYVKENIDSYNTTVIKELLPLKIIPYNAILSLAFKLLTDNSVIRNFYQRLYSTILVDEYQDTNILSYVLLNSLFTEKSKIILMGDTLQRIYGFIGAIPNLISHSEEQFKLNKIELNKNYRFQHNKQMLLLDSNIRKNAETPTSPNISEIAKIEFSVFDSQSLEAEYLINQSLELIEKNPDSKIAILVKQRGNNINAIIDEFNDKEVAFFYGLFTDDDPNYLKFNRECLFEFIELIRIKDQVTKKMTTSLINKIKSKITNSDALTNSLFILLEIFLSKVFTDFSFLSNDEKVSLIKDTFESYGLKQYVEFVEAKIIISTVHGSKGLEWDFVILPDMEAFSFPNYYGLCGYCGCGTNCNLNVTKEIENRFLEELSVFYVAVTRARKQVYFSASKTQLDFKNQNVSRNISCLLKLPGIEFKAK